MRQELPFIQKLMKVVKESCKTMKGLFYTFIYLYIILYIDLE